MRPLQRTGAVDEQLSGYDLMCPEGFSDNFESCQVIS